MNTVYTSSQLKHDHQALQIKFYRNDAHNKSFEPHLIGQSYTIKHQMSFVLQVRRKVSVHLWANQWL